MLYAGVALGAPDDRNSGAKRGGARLPIQTSECNDVPAHPCDLILGRPTRDSVTLSVLAYQDTEGCVAYGTQAGRCTAQTPWRLFKQGEPVELVLGSLLPNTPYHYQFQRRGTNSVAATFHTQRPPGNAFTFTITADSHLDEHTRSETYRRTLARARADAPDFHIDLGDTFMTETPASRDAAYKQYLAQRYYFGTLSDTAPLFLVLGNHDGETPGGRGQDAAGLALWSNTMRKRYFPNPVPDGFFTGNAAKHPEAGLLQDYYAWEWGDALLVVLDPFWYTQRSRGKGDNWKRSLGAEQYQWLKQTLEGSHARFKFIFIHNLVGGADEQSRGGVEAAAFFEWGGRNLDGTDGFPQNRPGWPAPIHQLLVQNNVTMVFHGHDHLYAQERRDGIVYQEVPQPGNPRGNTRNAAAYGYRGEVDADAGYLRVAVSAREVKVDYVRSDGTVARTYVVAASSP